ncbi:MAG: peptide/nickel transport system permease protein, partial [Euryarchaeota archaeon]|nr:peptide/nickel transport system permease protein [Euryarchaeota archaeon]
MSLFNNVQSILNDRLAMTGLLLIVALSIVAIFAPYLAPFDPLKTNLPERLLHPSIEHLMGTDN